MISSVNMTKSAITYKFGHNLNGNFIFCAVIGSLVLNGLLRPVWKKRIHHLVEWLTVKSEQFSSLIHEFF